MIYDIVLITFGLVGGYIATKCGISDNVADYLYMKFLEQKEKNSDRLKSGNWFSSYTKLLG